jgi:hypothetical protein
MDDKTSVEYWRHLQSGDTYVVEVGIGGPDEVQNVAGPIEGGIDGRPADGPSFWDNRDLDWVQENYRDFTVVETP